MIGINDKRVEGEQNTILLSLMEGLLWRHHSTPNNVGFAFARRISITKMAHCHVCPM
jgi:hypothetical protein